MIQGLTGEEKQRLSVIIFNNIPDSAATVRQSDPEEKKKLQSILAQKIAYEAVRDAPASQPQAQSDWCKNACFCLFPETYAHFFDITTELFLKRCASTLMFWSNRFLTVGDGKFQLYGPLWIGITYAIVLSISANLAAYYSHQEQFRFVPEYVIRAFAVTALWGLVVPLVVNCLVKIMKGDMPALASLCIYGYSLLWFLIPTAACCIPSLFWQVGMLSLAAFFNCVFLLRNYHSYTGKDLQANVYLLHICIIIFEAVNFLVVKQAFFSNATPTVPIATTRHHNYHSPQQFI